MATNISTTYAGEFAGKYISPALLSAPTIFNGGVEVKPNIKFKEVIKILDTTSLLADGTCDFSDNGDINLTERIIEPKELQVNLNLCKADFRSDWEAMQMGMSVMGETLPPSFADFLLGHVASKVAQQNEINFWQGDKANGGEYDGILTILAAETGFTGDVTATTVTAANVIDELGKVVDAIPQAVYGSEDLKLYVSSNILRAYIRALGGFGAAGLGANGVDNQGTQWYNNGAVSFDGIPVFLAQGLPSNTAVAAQSSNLFFGTSLLSDTQEAKVLDMADLDGSQNVRIIMRMLAAAQVGNINDVVVYS